MHRVYTKVHTIIHTYIYIQGLSKRFERFNIIPKLNHSNIFERLCIYTVATWSRTLIEKLIVSQLVESLLAFCKTRTSTTVNIHV